MLINPHQTDICHPSVDEEETNRLMYKKIFVMNNCKEIIFPIADKLWQSKDKTCTQV